MFKGNGVVQLTGRRPYEGVMPPYKAVIKGNFEIFASSPVDNEIWHTVQVTPRVTKWIKEQNTSMWYSHKTSSKYKVLDTFDIHNKLYTMMALKFS
jgi:hypothetical protein